MKRSIHQTAAVAFMLMSATITAPAQNSEMEQLRSEMKAMQETIYSLSTNLANANAKLAEMEKQQKAPPPPATETVKTELGVPPPTSPGATPKAKVAPPSDLADGTTHIVYRDTIKEDDLGAARPGNAPLDPTYEGFMQLFGTKTWVKLGGYAKLDMIFDSTKVGNPNEFITREIPVEGEPNFGKGEQFAMQAKQTRISLELRSPTPIGSMKIYYENDFFNNAAEPTMDYRLRHFYGQVRNVLAGQTWTTFYDVDSFPDTIDFEGPGSLPVLRQPQLRYTIPLVKDSMDLAFAIEQPKSDISDLPPDASGRNIMPDFTSHFRWEGKAGHLQLSGVLRALSFDSNTNSDDTKLGWGVQLSGGLNLWCEDTMVANLIYGDGIGRYIQDLPSGSAAVVDADGDLQTMRSWGGEVGYTHHWSEKWRSTASFSYVQLDNLAELGGFAYGHTYYAQANLIWAPTKNFYVGIEYLYGRKETRNGNSGDDNRVQLALQYKLVR